MALPSVDAGAVVAILKPDVVRRPAVSDRKLRPNEPPKVVARPPGAAGRNLPHTDLDQVRACRPSKPCSIAWTATMMES
jgi:hypothetical protein